MHATRRSIVAGLAATIAAPKLSKAAQVVADDTGRDIPVPSETKRVFPAGPPAAILLYTLAPELLLGWPRPNRAEECVYMLPDICRKPEVGRITGRGNTANLEVVLALKPDIILDVGSTAETYASLARRTQDQTSIPYALFDGRFDNTAATYRKLGRLIGRERAGEDLAAYADRTISTITQRIAHVERPRVYYARGPRGLTTGLGGSINVETIELLARNVAGHQRGGLANVSIEQVLVWNPDVIVTIDQEFAATVRDDPAWSSLKAVRAGRVHLSPKLPFGWVDFPPSVNRLIGLWWLAKILYPEKFPEDIKALTGDFYEKFYHVRPTAAQIDHVLAGRG
jgi:iron complex transport system substrate-binding protein